MESENKAQLSTAGAGACTGNNSASFAAKVFVRNQVKHFVRIRMI
jgi:hypothetical protein